MPTKLRPANISIVSPIPIASFKYPKARVTAKARLHAKQPVTGLAIALYSFEYTSLMRSQGSGPYPTEKAIRWMHREDNGNQPRLAVAAECWSSRIKYTPRTASISVMKTLEITRRIFLPTRSTRNVPIMVATSKTAPITIVWYSASISAFAA